LRDFSRVRKPNLFLEFANVVPSKKKGLKWDNRLIKHILFGGQLVFGLDPRRPGCQHFLQNVK
jgi:hypothetical protein